MKRTERHRLKENELAQTVARAREFLEIYRKPLIAGAVAVAVVAVAVIAWMAWRSEADSTARTMLADALTTAQAPVAPAPVPGATTPPAAAQPGSFPTERARDEAALAKFVATANAYPSSDAGIAASYQAATMLSLLGRTSEAVQRYQDLASRAGRNVYGEMAKLGLAQSQASAGQYDQAIAIYKDLAAGKDSSLPVDGILMQMGKACSDAGKTGDARHAFERIVDEFPQSPYAPEAKKALDQMKG